MGSRKLLQKTCLKQHFSLRRQLLTSFGSAAFVILTLVVVASIVMLTKAGNLVKDRSSGIMMDQIHNNLVETTKSTAEMFGKFQGNYEGVVQQVVEIVLDRIVGYPEAGWEEDEYVPFFDMESQRNVYPLKSHPVPLDWRITPDITEENKQEVIPEREDWFEVIRHFTTYSTAAFFFQGICDPDVPIPDRITYYPDCTEENNDVEKGGVVHPTNTAGALYKKSADLALLMRPIFEANSDVFLVGVYYVNSGAGAVLSYPGHFYNGLSLSYKSVGCDWMRARNPITGRQLASEEEISRCHPSGEMVNGREYNPIERDWFRDIVLHHSQSEGNIHWVGPYRAAGLGVSLMTLGKTLFDRKTGELIGVVTVDIALPDLNANLENSRLYEHSEWAVMNMYDGRVVTDSLHSTSFPNATEPGDDVFVSWISLDILSDMSFMAMRDVYTELFASEWTQESLAAAAASTVQNCPYGVSTAYPLPVPPKEYDPNYQPYSMAVQVVANDAFSVIEELESSIDEDVLTVSLITVGVGLFGMFVILVILWCVARVLTKPLLWMELVSWRIVNHGDKRSGDALRVDDDDDLTATVRCSPRTEITELVEEFRFMITGFSGDGAASVAESEANEVRNTLTWQSAFSRLYTKVPMKRKSIRSGVSAVTPLTEPTDIEDSFSSPPENYEEINDEEEVNNEEVFPLSDNFVRANKIAMTAPSPVVSVDGSKSHKLIPNNVFPAPPKKHSFPVAARLPEDRLSGFDEGEVVYRSRLFCWIVVLIVVPLLITNVVITTIVTQNIISTVPAWVDDLSQESYELEIRALSTIVKSKASLLSMIMEEPIRDLHLLTRVVGWLHFGAVERADSFTEVSLASEECKTYAPETCPVFQTPEFQCRCDWNDPFAVGSCVHEPNRLESRRQQRRFFEVEAQDIDPVTGARNSTSFNQTAYSAETTLWQKDLSELPGAHKGSNASGFETTYDRARVSSALAVVEFPVYNYQNAMGRQRQVLGSYMSYEADGASSGFSGCSYLHTGFASFVSNSDNKAFEVSKELCPEGKHGFDPRCRNWYSAMREKFLSSKEMIHITAPYVFIDENSVGLSAAAPVANPATGELVGVMLLDFVPYGLREAFVSLELPTSWVITPEQDIYGGDIVVGPNKTKPWSPALIIDELLDANDDEGRKEFESRVLEGMQTGEAGVGEYLRRGADGQKRLAVTVYAPVNQTIVSPVDPSDLSRGVSVTHKTIYSVAVSCFQESMQQPFREAEDSMADDLDRLAIIDAALVLFFTVVFLVIACKITVHVTAPMITLLSAVRSINSREEKRDIPPLQGGSREVHQVYNSFSKLYKVVRISNTAFFSGNLLWANHIVNDAIQLFRKINDRKAIGIACNNLGNIMFARILELGKESESALNYGFGSCANEHYDEAVEISQEGFDKAENTEEKATFACELADRLFNRGLYLLFMDGEADAPENAREKGLVDITRARDLDYDVKEFYIDNKLLLHFSGDCFNRMIRRIHGLCGLYNDVDVRTIWDPSRLVEEADELLFAAWYEKSAPLFREISRVGRLQQLEGAAMRLEGCKGNHAEAARVGMRMFTEDEYLLEGPFALSSTALLHFAQGDEQVRWNRKTMTTVRADLRRMSRQCRSPTLDLGKCVIFALELNERLESDELFPKINAKCMNLFDNHCTDEDYVGMVAYTVSGDHTLELSSKAENADQQRAVLDLATSSTSERVCSALPFAMQVVLDSSVSQEMDSYILLFTDGYSWDSDPYKSIKWQIARMNRENENNVHLIILGLDMEAEHIVEECRSMCTVSKGSFFVELTPENIDETFSFISSIFSTGRLYQQFLSTITMQRF